MHEQKVNELLLDCSDAHCFSDNIAIKDRLGNCKTWIKADTSFEGLISITYEPETRVKVQENIPENKLSSNIIDSIKLNEEFGNSTIYLNQNLNTVIGGRSSGKSLLLSLIAKKLDPNIENVKIK